MLESSICIWLHLAASELRADGFGSFVPSFSHDARFSRIGAVTQCLSAHRSAGKASFCRAGP